jgi:glycine/D-amino acid oxidase-like deaminating enzyme
VNVVVIGAGVAGTGAAIAVARAGARVLLVDGGTGASTLWTGRVAPHTAEASAEGVAIGEELGVKLGRSIVVTMTGYAPGGHGHEAALLDLHPLLSARARVGVVRCQRPGWDAEAIVQAAGAGFVVVDAAVLRHVDERHAPDADFAARHDDADRLGWLAERLRDALGRIDERPTALLLPPCLGIARERASELSKLVGVTCGEAMGLPGGPTGLRFESARNKALAAAGVEVLRETASAIHAAGSRWRVETGSGRLDAGAVIVATGGFVGGGLAYQPSESMEAAALPPMARAPFRCTIDAPLPLGSRGLPLESPGSLFGVPPESLAWPHAADALMDRVGVLCDEEGRVEPGLYAAGELEADAPRTWLSALESGVRAGAAAARDVLTATAPRSSPAEAPASRP